MRSNVLRSAVVAMSFLSSDDRVRQEARAVLRAKGQPRELPFVSPVATKLTAVDFAPRRFQKVRDWIADLNAALDEASAAGSPFAAFPELTGLTALGLLPRASKALEALREGLAEEDGRGDAAMEAVQITQGCLGELFFNVFSELARGHKLLIAAGGFYVREGGALYNRQYLFSETGELLTQQDKLILSPFERAMGVKAQSVITPADTRIGRVALLTASCAPHYEPFAAAAALGCRIVTAGASPFGEGSPLLRCRAQEQALCVVCAGAHGGRDFGLSLQSEPVVYAPRSTLRARDGIAAAGKAAHTITARVDLSEQGAAFDHYTADRNVEFLARALGAP